VGKSESLNKEESAKTSVEGSGKEDKGERGGELMMENEPKEKHIRTKTGRGGKKGGGNQKSLNSRTGGSRDAYHDIGITQTQGESYVPLEMRESAVVRRKRHSGPEKGGEDS